MQIISPAQCRAARALLNWSQPELAERCDIHVQTISNFEKESSSPSRTTLEKIIRIFLYAGILFSEDNGVKMTTNIVSIYDGDDSAHTFMENVYQDVKDAPGTEVLIYGLTKWGDEKETEFARNHVEKLLAAGVSRRLLVEEDYNNFLNPKSSYRFIEKKYFPYAAFELYSDKLALREWGPNPKIVVIKEKLFADAFRKLFELAWDNAKPMK